MNFKILAIITTNNSSKFIAYLPDSAQISQVKDVMKFSRSRQHLDLGFLPENSGQWHQFFHNVNQLGCRNKIANISKCNIPYTDPLLTMPTNLLLEFSFLAEVPKSNSRENSVNRII